MRFRLSDKLNNSRAARELAKASISDRMLNMQTGKRVRQAFGNRSRSFAPGPGRKHPGTIQPIATEDQLPDFEVVIVVEKQRGNGHTASLHWMLAKQQGEFPIVPEAIDGGKIERHADMQPHRFATRREAIIEASRQGRVLTQQFVEWATTGVEDGV